MTWLRLADAVVAAHALFVLFVVGGGLLALRWPRAAWVHLPCAAWGALIEFAGLICPLTPLENWLRARGGGGRYGGGFIEHYVMPVLYPPGLTRDLQIALGVGVLVLDVVVYALVLRRRRATRVLSG